VRVVPNASFVQVHHKLDVLGIGAQHTKDPNGIAWKQNQDFENLLKRLNANSDDSQENEVDSSPISGFRPPRAGKSIVDAVTVRSETEERVEDKKAEKDRKRKKKKRLRDDDETAGADERKPKKRKQVAPASEPVEVDPSPTLETIASVVIDHSHSKVAPDS